jgi:hypothetical protein
VRRAARAFLRRAGSILDISGTRHPAPCRPVVNGSPVTNGSRVVLVSVGWVTPFTGTVTVVMGDLGFVEYDDGWHGWEPLSRLFSLDEP